MQTLIQFIIEAARSDERARKLLDRIAGMKKFGANKELGTIHVLSRRTKHRYGGKGSSPDTHDPRRNKKFSPNTIDPDDYEESPHEEKVPLKHVGAAQDKVLVAGVHRQLTTPTSKKPKMFKMVKKDGTHAYIIRDGNHRVAAARLRGDTHIDAHVYSRKKESHS